MDDGQTSKGCARERGAWKQISFISLGCGMYDKDGGAADRPCAAGVGEACARPRSFYVASGPQPPPGRGHGLPHAPSLLHPPDVLQELSSSDARYTVESASQSRKRLRAENTMEVRAGVEPRQATVKRA